jgi:hypothetical protein
MVSSVSTASAPLPPLAMFLGLAGLAPFVAGAVGVWALPVDRTAQMASALAAYAAVIVSFLGGIHWGLAFRDPGGADTFSWVWGVTPSLLVWAALLLPTLSGSLGAAGVALLLCWAVDLRRYPMAGAQRWLPLRHGLTAVAALCCFAGAAGV